MNERVEGKLRTIKESSPIKLTKKMRDIIPPEFQYAAGFIGVVVHTADIFNSKALPMLSEINESINDDLPIIYNVASISLFVLASASAYDGARRTAKKRAPAVRKLLVKLLKSKQG